MRLNKKYPEAFSTGRSFECPSSIFCSFFFKAIRMNVQQGNSFDDDGLDEGDDIERSISSEVIFFCKENKKLQNFNFFSETKHRSHDGQIENS